MDTTVEFSARPRRAAATVVAIALAVLGLVVACGSDDAADSGTVATDPVNLDDRGLPDGRDPAAMVPWNEVGPGWTLAAYDPASLEETRTIGDFTADRPVGADGDPGGGGSTGDPLPSAPKAPEAGTVLDVVGVRYDDVLNFRSDPDPSAEIVATAHPDLAERPEDAVIVATGEAATSGSSVWWQVTVDGREAWANSRDLGVLGAGSDALELIDLEAIGDQVGLEDVVAEARSPGDATGVLLEVFGVDAISSIYSIDVLGTYGNGVKGERFEIETYNVKADDPDATPYVIGPGSCRQQECRSVSSASTPAVTVAEPVGSAERAFRPNSALSAAGKRSTSPRANSR